MEINQIIAKLNHEVPKSVLQKPKFGRSDQLSVWIEMSRLHDVASFLASDPEIALDWLENFSVVEMEGSLIFTYFLRSHSNGSTLVLRGASDVASSDQRVEIPSVSSVWGMAERLEAEAAELFGLKLIHQKKAPNPEAGLLPEGWRGFPMRKGYVFPESFLGVDHFRQKSVSTDHDETSGERT